MMSCEKVMSQSRLVVLLGGSGYIGTHLMLELHGKPCPSLSGGKSSQRFQVVIIANKEPHPQAVEYAERNADGLKVLFWNVDLMTDPSTYPKMPSVPHCGIMLAALKDVTESETLPYDYLRTNITICINSMKYLTDLGVVRLIQASSAAVYHTDSPHTDNIEGMDYGEPIGVYGYTKRVTEDICRRLLVNREDLRQELVMLRYMNPIGSHPNVNAFADIGICAHLSKLTSGSVFVNRGNCLRDYIHITDLASYHTALLDTWQKTIFPPQHCIRDRVVILNVGTGVPVSVEQLVRAFDKQVGLPLREMQVAPRPQHEGSNTVASVIRTGRMVPDWWWSRPRKSLEEALADYCRLTFPSSVERQIASPGLT